jgi:hypothetical protein
MATAITPSTGSSASAPPAESLPSLNLLIFDENRPSREACRQALREIDATIKDANGMDLRILFDRRMLKELVWLCCNSGAASM